MNVKLAINFVPALLALALCVPAAQANATSIDSAPIAASYTAAFAPEFGIASVARQGELKLVMLDGTISGTYRGDSIVPDPLNDRIEAVAGSVDGSNVQFYIGQAIWFSGRITADGTISGTATIRGRPYDFVAARTHSIE
jgi:hypothetical protein